MVCIIYFLSIYINYLFKHTGSSELLPGGGVEGGNGNGNETSSNRTPKPNKFETMICTTLTEMNDKALSNMERIISKMQKQESDTNVTTNVNNVMSALNNLEDQKRKLETEVSTMDEEDAKVKRLTIINKIDKKIEELYDKM